VAIGKLGPPTSPEAHEFRVLLFVLFGYSRKKQGTAKMVGMAAAAQGDRISRFAAGVQPAQLRSFSSGKRGRWILGVGGQFPVQD